MGKKKILSLALVASMMLSANSVIAYADNTQDITSGGTTLIPVTADIDSTYVVTIPKSIVLDGETGRADYGTYRGRKWRDSRGRGRGRKDFQ